jgi:uncharacterized protein with ParB-like and HNH nuclease domain
MKASETKLQKIIEGTNQYVVPLYQRQYSWEPREWNVLWDDLMDLADDQNARTHFIGSIVTMPTQSVPEGVAKFLLIDGQQRVTTFFILLAAIRDRANELQLGTLGPEIDETLLRNKFKQGNDEFKLLPTQADRDAFIRVMSGDALQEDGQITKAYRFFAKEIRSRDGLDLERLKHLVVSSLILVSIVLDRDDNPHLIFESLNAKGRALTQADLIRNYFFMHIHVNEQDRLFNEYWRPMQNALDDNLTECIRHFLMKDGDLVKQGEVYFALKMRADARPQSAVLEYLAELSQFASYYAKLLAPDKEQDTAIADRLRRLNRIEVTTAYPFLLNVYHDYMKGRITSGDFVAVLELLENFMIRRWVCAVPTYGLNKIFPVLYKQASEYAPLVEGLRQTLKTKNYPRDAEFRERLVSSKLYGPAERAGKTKLILERLEESFDHREPVDFQELTIEHVMPQTLTPWWQQHLGDSWEGTHELLLHTLGNLTLTGYNSPMQNDSFPDKKRVLTQSHLELNGAFAAVTAWNEDAIRSRAETLARRALAIWGYFGDPQESGADLGSTDVTGRVPTGVSVLGQRFGAETWRDVVQRTVEAVATLDPTLFQTLVLKFPGFLGNDPNKFRSSRQLANGVFVNTHFSAANAKRFCLQLTEDAGISSQDFRIEF